MRIGCICYDKTQRGFSLVELSIVLVILGLLSGGILTGQSLIRAAEMRSVLTQTQAVQVATMSFRGRYFYLPGDLPNATDFWGAAHSTPATCYTTVGTGTETCNGNGDGFVKSADGGTTYSERWRYWQQLANAGLIEGSYSGVQGAAGIEDPDPGVNVPLGKIGGTCLDFSYILSNASSLFFDSALNKHWLAYGSRIPNLGCGVPVFKPEEAWNVDTKIDDGRPGQGKVMSGSPTSNPGCADSADENSAVYQLDQTGQNCSILINFDL